MRGRKHLEAEPILDNRERKIKLNQQGEGRGESEGALFIFQHQISKSGGKQRIGREKKQTSSSVCPPVPEVGVMMLLSEFRAEGSPILCTDVTPPTHSLLESGCGLSQ